MGEKFGRGKGNKNGSPDGKAMVVLKTQPSTIWSTRMAKKRRSKQKNWRQKAAGKNGWFHKMQTLVTKKKLKKLKNGRGQGGTKEGKPIL